MAGTSASLLKLRLNQLTSLAICFHIVLKVNSTKEWNDTQVLMAWCSLYQLPVLCDRYLKGEISTEAELRRVKEYVTEIDVSIVVHEGHQ